MMGRVYPLALIWRISVNKSHDLLLYIIYADVRRIKPGPLMRLDRLDDVLCKWFSGTEVKSIKSSDDMNTADFF